MAYYSLDNTINEFFSACTVTQEECDKTAAKLTGNPVEPVQLQGAFSYTVTAGNLIVQFREPKSPLDTKTLDLARNIYGSVVPACTYKGTMGPAPSLSVYVMDKVPGRSYIEARLARSPPASWLEQAVTDFARFFAKSWVNRLPLPYHSELTLADLQAKFDLLARELPTRFISAITTLRAELPLLFTPGYPLVLTHTDLCEMNVMVDPETGGITGIIDWAEAKVLPFGMALWGVLNMLGSMDSRGWTYRADSAEFEKLFWDTFYDIVGRVSAEEGRAMKVAERVGLVLRYAFAWDDGVSERVVTEEDSRVKYLDAFLHRLQD
ncbi:aminoglycoside phosphotransferase family protein [Aspergillus mulundensis]|uniref:Aminoglycoside phosphotransferase domain-containing protein n=1 Tax=Aspergillus mulundensis TaxID=1810919 RepID=A0A3D8S4P7_9EURO|nr:hypothetical protein DSM5745_04830 [Aspergillus mulundensis]RDW81273.1 hypothetical protein DSM5745_04830 [Aspergillus mulundensis]